MAETISQPAQRRWMPLDRLRSVGAARTAPALPPRRRLALAAALVLAAGLNLLWISREGYSNPYYAATVRSMLTS